jgi:hypothetical protein
MPIEKDGPCKGNDLSFVGMVGFQHRTKDCLIYTFLAKEFDEFKVAPILELIKTGFRDISQKMGADFGVEILHCPQHC